MVNFLNFRGFQKIPGEDSVSFPKLRPESWPVEDSGPRFGPKFRGNRRETWITAMLPAQVSRSRHESSERIFAEFQESNEMPDSSVRMFGMFQDSDHSFMNMAILVSVSFARIGVR